MKEKKEKYGGKRYNTLSSMASILSLSPLSQKITSSDDFQFWKLQNGWKKIVGPVIGKESFIRNRRGHTLTIQVTNSIFRQQLFMMKQHLLDRIHEDPYGKQFTDLSFVIGPMYKMKKTESSIDPVNRHLKEEQKIHEEPLSEQEKEWIRNWTKKNVASEKIRPAISHMMEEVLKMRKGRLAEGWHPCAVCGTLCPKEKTICSSCERELRKTKENRIIRLLKEKPHFSYKEVSRIIPCSYAAYDRARDVLIKRYKENIFHRYSTAEEKKRLLSMLIHVPVSQISNEKANETLSKMPQQWWK